MAFRRHSWRVEVTHHGMRLDQFLAETLPGALGREVTRSQVRRLIATGAVTCNGQPERNASCCLTRGTRVDVHVDPAQCSDAGAVRHVERRTEEFAWTPARILFEDEWLIVVDKPPGLPTQPTLDPRRASVVSTLQDHLLQRDGGTPYLGLHHRLDRDTTGVVLFTRDPRVNAGVTALFAGRSVRKTYAALAVAGPRGPDEWEVRNHLGVVGRVGKVSKQGAVPSGGDPAQTSFRVVERLRGALQIEARPHTGRTHQIRVHLAEGGRPILGDELYGGPLQLTGGAGRGGVAIPRVLLHAAELEFLHPVTQAPLRLQSPLPADFEACRARLRERA
jgi:RluA family pseudouridine synthase